MRAFLFMGVANAPHRNPHLQRGLVDNLEMLRLWFVPLYAMKSNFKTVDAVMLCSTSAEVREYVKKAHNCLPHLGSLDTIIW